MNVYHKQWEEKFFENLILFKVSAMSRRCHSHGRPQRGAKQAFVPLWK